MAEIIKLVRHGESLANLKQVNPNEVGDHTIPLSDLGHAQAHATGERIGADFIRSALVYCSPYRRTRQTLDGLLHGAAVPRAELRIYEDPRLREVEHGYEDVDAQEEHRKIHGSFYYRFRGGESPAHCFDRTASFLESMRRQANRKAARRVLIVTHGLTIRCFVMRYLHLSVEEFDQLANPRNCDVITIAHRTLLEDPQFTSGRWGVTGLRLRAAGE